MAAVVRSVVLALAGVGGDAFVVARADNAHVRRRGGAAAHGGGQARGDGQAPSRSHAHSHGLGRAHGGNGAHRDGVRHGGEARGDPQASGQGPPAAATLTAAEQARSDTGERGAAYVHDEALARTGQGDAPRTHGALPAHSHARSRHPWANPDQSPSRRRCKSPTTRRCCIRASARSSSSTWAHGCRSAQVAFLRGRCAITPWRGRARHRLLELGTAYCRITTLVRLVLARAARAGTNRARLLGDPCP